MIPQINIQSTLGSIGIRYTPMQLNIQTQQANLSIQSPAAQLSIQVTPGDLEIDQTEAFNQEGLMSESTLIKNIASQAEQAVAQGVANTADWGARFADLAHHSADVAQFVSRYQGQTHTFGPGLVPTPFSVHISYRMSQLSIQAVPSNVQIQSTPHDANISVQPGSAETYVQTPPSVQITPPAMSQLIDVKA